MKTCPDCRQTKSLDDFYAHPDGNQGRMHICKDCHKRRMWERRRTNPAVQDYDRKRYQRPDRKQKGVINARQWRVDHPDAYKAQTAVNNALRDRRLKKLPCSFCGTTKNVHGHHKDYSKPLDVIWLCAKCHHRLHATFPELGGHNEARP